MTVPVRRLAPVVLAVGVALIGLADRSVAQQTVESRHTSSKVRFQEVISGHLEALNGRFKLRAIELVLEPDGFIGAHHHVGPGLRYVAAGQIVFTQGGKATVYKTGDFFFESGNIVHTSQNKTKSPARVIVFEIVPADYSGPSSIVPKS